MVWQLTISGDRLVMSNHPKSQIGVSVVGQYRHFPRAPLTARYASWFFVSCRKFVWWKFHGYFLHGWADYELHRYPPYWDDNRDKTCLKRYFEMGEDCNHD
jgi:hypothetical protein